MAKKTKQRTGIVFHHSKTELPALWITQYENDWKNQDDPNLYRVRCSDDLPDLSLLIDGLGLPLEIWASSGKEGIYRFMQAFFYDFCKTKKDRKEADKNCLDWWFFLLPSGFPDKTIPGV